MIHEKKVITCSVLALIIGVASIVPLVFFMSTAKAETTPKPQFNVEIPYAYICRGTSSVPSGPGNPMIDIQTVSCYVAFNSTLIDEDRSLYDARIEYYIIDIYSDKGYIGNLTQYTGASYSNTFRLPNFFFSRDQWFATDSSANSNFDGAGGSFYYNLTTGESLLTGRGSGGNEWVPRFGEPETITISVRRLGWITFNGNSTTATLANGEEIAKVQLVKFGDGFLYNNLIPEDQLPQTDLLNPQLWKAPEA